MELVVVVRRGSSGRVHLFPWEEFPVYPFLSPLQSVSLLVFWPRLQAGICLPQYDMRCPYPSVVLRDNPRVVSVPVMIYQ
jgi:hypothetical protein